MLTCGLRQQPDGIEVDRHHPTPVLQRHVGRCLAVDNARIIYKYIEPAQRVTGKADDISSSGLIHATEIRLHCGSLAAQRLDLGDGLVRLVAAVGQRHIGTGAGKGKGDALTDARRTAGDQRLPARQIKRICHAQYLFAMGNSSAGKSEITSQPFSVTTTSSSIRAAE